MSKNKFLITFNNIQFLVYVKRMKNIRLRFDMQNRIWKISIPLGLKEEKLFEFLNDNKDWLNNQNKEIQKKIQIKDSKYKDGEIHLLFGDEYYLRIEEGNNIAKLDKEKKEIILYISKGLDPKNYIKIMENLYGEELEKIILGLFKKWESIIGVKAGNIHIKSMKSRWGSCNPKSKSISINSALGRHPIIHIEHVIVHELIHLLEPSHNNRFYFLLDKFQPGWRTIDKAIKNLGLSC